MDFVRRLVRGPERKHRQWDQKRFLRLVISYAPDWIFTIVLLAIIGYFTDLAGYKRQFSLTDTSIQHTFTEHQRVSFPECIVYAGVVPAILILLIALIWRRSFWDWHSGWLGLLLSVSLTTVFTQVVKVTVGRPRPDLIDRCQPVEGAANAPVYGLATWEICTVQSGHIFDDGFKSFPSGHSSFAWSGLLYLSLYLCGKMHIMDRRGHAWKAWIAITPPIGAALIAVSRTMDYRHHATDVIAGSILGIVISWMTYHLYYPSLWSPQCHLPYSPRIPPTLPSDQLDSEPEGTARRPRGDGRGHGAVLPMHRDSASIDSNASMNLSDRGLSPTSPNTIPLEAPHPAALSPSQGETAPRPMGGGYTKGQYQGYYPTARHD
ncbi:hypothetical protein Rhopal_004349-T1 [Rhodotorula paludigena]|uniref:Phosphatidic acid phosphatase type 2/haloperoxidase domain-containing protein n=1 Tax=Rhodotorula paludigena TaxID=86838 RepID=A0AAV5GRK6_9BASI|nr:hypothetical protein Rhopal_004349-T1 [Rhodotorula paludigena]